MSHHRSLTAQGENMGLVTHIRPRVHIQAKGCIVRGLFREMRMRIAKLQHRYRQQKMRKMLEGEIHIPMPKFAKMRPPTRID